MLKYSIFEANLNGLQNKIDNHALMCGFGNIVLPRISPLSCSSRLMFPSPILVLHVHWYGKALALQELRLFTNKHQEIAFDNFEVQEISYTSISDISVLFKDERETAHIHASSLSVH